MSIRTASPADVPGIFEVRTSVHDNHMSMEALARAGITPESVLAMMDRDTRAWVADVDGEVVAFSMAIASKATVFAMFVAPEFEGRGLGRALMSEAETWLFDQGCSEIWLLTDARREVRANGFYRHLGWHDDGVQDDGQVRFTKRAVLDAGAPNFL